MTKSDTTLLRTHEVEATSDTIRLCTLSARLDILHHSFLCTEREIPHYIQRHPYLHQKRNLTSDAFLLRAQRADSSAKQLGDLSMASSQKGSPEVSSEGEHGLQVGANGVAAIVQASKGWFSLGNIFR